MKSRNLFLFGAAAGIAVAGLAAYLLSSERGKDVSRKLKKDGRRFFRDLERAIDDTRSKIEEVKEAMHAECNEDGKKSTSGQPA